MMVAHAVSLFSGLFLLVVAVMVMWTYRPRTFVARTAAELLGLGIFLSFASDATNTIWWQVLFNLSDTFGWFDHDNFQLTGRWLDGLFKGLAAVAGLIHLRARKKAMQSH